jgi:hypothetical protein
MSEATIEMILSKELKQKKKRDELNQVMGSQAYDKDNQIF